MLKSKRTAIIVILLKNGECRRMDTLALLIEEKKQREQEILDFNKRQDQMVFLYLAAVYSAIGLSTTGKLDLTALATKDEGPYLLFLFVFLNNCLFVHGISQTLWILSLSKYVHLKVCGEINLVLKNTNQHVPSSLNLWADWRSGVISAAIFSRGSAVILWVILGTLLSYLGFALIDLKPFYHAHPYLAGTMGVFLIFMQSYVFFLFSQEIYFAQRFHEEDDVLSFRGNAIRVTLSIFMSMGLALIVILVL